MKVYNVRPNQPKTRGGTCLRLHLHQYPDDECEMPKKRGPAKTRWLKGIAAHLQQTIVRAAADRGKGEKRIGRIPLSNKAVVIALENVDIKKRAASPMLVQLLNLDTNIVKGGYLKKTSRLEFKQTEKVCHYFDGKNNPRKTAATHFLSFRLLKEAPESLLSN